MIIPRTTSRGRRYRPLSGTSAAMATPNIAIIASNCLREDARPCALRADLQRLQNATGGSRQEGEKREISGRSVCTVESATEPGKEPKLTHLLAQFHVLK